MNAEELKREIEFRGRSIDGNRGTGRTTLMLKAAIEAAKAELPVCVIASTADVGKLFERMAKDLGAPRGLIKFASRDQAHLTMMGFRGVVFRDHYADECEARDLQRQVTDLREQLERAVFIARHEYIPESRSRDRKIVERPQMEITMLSRHFDEQHADKDKFRPIHF
jgi:hypothetical protein